jgi:hypothetical protein
MAANCDDVSVLLRQRFGVSALLSSSTTTWEQLPLTHASTSKPSGEDGNESAAYRRTFVAMH